MAEEKQTPLNQPVENTLTADDMSMLHDVLLDGHSRGMTPVAVYNQADYVPDEA